MLPSARNFRLIWTAWIGLLLLGCRAPALPKASPSAPSPSPVPISIVATTTASATSAGCQPSPIVMPTAPAIVPGYSEYDPATGLHMTGTVQYIDPQGYRLQVTGRVDHPLELTYDDLRCMPKIKTDAPLVCPDVFEDNATWAGASLAHILKLAGVQFEARRIYLMSADGYTTSVDLETALSEGNIIAYEWNGEPLPIFHGFPVRAVLPATTGSYWVKYLAKIDVK